MTGSDNEGNDSWHRAGRVVVTVERAKKLKNVQNALFGDQDPYVRGALVVGSDSELKYEVTRRENSKVSNLIREKEGADIVAALSPAQIAERVASDWQRTQTHADGGTKPDWSKLGADEWGRSNQLAFRFPGRDPAKKRPLRVVLTVKDAEKVGKDTTIGICIVNLEELVKSGKSTEIELEDKCGVLVVSAHFEIWPELCTRGTLHISLTKGVNLRKVASISSEKPYVLAQLLPDDSRGRTSTASGTSPVWDEEKGTIRLMYRGACNAAAASPGVSGLGLSLSIYDQNILQHDRCMGRTWVDVGAIIKAGVDHAGKIGKGKKGESPTDTEQPEPEIMQLTMWDDKYGTQTFGKLECKLWFEPLYSNADQNQQGADGPIKKRALLIGINYEGKEGTLRGCHNDCLEQQAILQNKFKVSDMKLLMDTKGAKKHELPTAENIRKGLQWLLEGATAGDKLYLHYSGHGSQVADESGDEDDGQDETLVPLDFDWNDPKTYLTDDELTESFFCKVPRGVDLTVVFDCCHSGTLMDGTNVTRIKDGGKIQPAQGDGAEDVASRFLNPTPAVLARIEELRKKKQRDFSSRFFNKAKGAVESGKRSLRVSKAKNGASIVVISGCRDDQTSADAHIDGKFMGALTWSLLQVMNKNSSGLALNTLIADVRTQVKERKWTQVPQLSFGTAKSKSSVWMQGWDSASAPAQEESETEESENQEEEFKTAEGDEQLPETTVGDESLPLGVIVDTEARSLGQQARDMANKPQVDDDSDADEDDYDEEEDDFEPAIKDKVWSTMSRDMNYLRKEDKSSVSEANGANEREEDENARAGENSRVGEISRKGSKSLGRFNGTATLFSRRKVGTAVQGTEKPKKLVFSKTRIGIDTSKGLRKRRGSTSSKGSMGKSSSLTQKRTGSKKKGNALDPNRPSFLARMESVIDSRENSLKKRREKEAYDLRQDKKVCPCGQEQSYEEVVKRRKNCQECGQRYRSKISWSEVQSGFMQRNIEKPGGTEERTAKKTMLAWKSRTLASQHTF